MEPEDTAHLLDGLGNALGGMARPHDQLGLDPVDVGACILDNAVVALLDRPVLLDRDDRMGLNRRGDGDLLQALDKGVARRHVVDGGRDDRKTHKGVPVPEDLTRHLRGDRGRGQKPLDEVADEFPPRDEAAAMRGGNEHHARDLGQRLEKEALLQQFAGALRQLKLLERFATHSVPEAIPGVDGLHFYQ